MTDVAVKPRPASRRSNLGRWLDRLLVPASVVVMVIFWEYAVTALAIPEYLVPPPSAVFRSLSNMWESGLLVTHGVITLLEAALGFLIAFILSTMLAIGISEFRLFERLIYPYLAALQSMPKVAIAPLVMIWFGMGIESKIVLSALLSFFPMLVNAVEGLKSIDDKRARLFRSLGASRLQTLRLLKIPNALPFLLVGIELGTIYAMLGAIVAEFVGSSQGLGAYLLSMNFQMDAAGSFALLAVLALYGILMQFVLRAVRNRLLFWSRNTNHSQGA